MIYNSLNDINVLVKNVLLKFVVGCYSQIISNNCKIFCLF